MHGEVPRVIERGLSHGDGGDPALEDVVVVLSNCGLVHVSLLNSDVCPVVRLAPWVELAVGHTYFIPGSNERWCWSLAPLGMCECTAVIR